jgi:hypothetical protein
MVASAQRRDETVAVLFARFFSFVWEDSAS